MKQTFNIGNLDTGKDKLFEQIKNSLIELGIISPNITDDLVFKEMNNALNGFKPILVSVLDTNISFNVGFVDKENFDISGIDFIIKKYFQLDNENLIIGGQK